MTALQVFSNFASTTLAVPALSTDLSLTVTNANQIPTLLAGQYCYAVLGNPQTGPWEEVCIIGPYTSGTTTLTLGPSPIAGGTGRGMDGTIAQAWSAGATIQIAPVAQAMADITAQLASTAAGQGDALITTLDTHSGAVAQTQHQVNSERVSVFRWLTSGQITDIVSNTGSIDVSSAIITAATAINGTGKTLYFPAGTYLWATAKTINFVPVWEGEGPAYPTTAYSTPGVIIKCTVTGAYALTVSPSSFGDGIYLRNIRFTGGKVTTPWRFGITAQLGAQVTASGNTYICVQSGVTASSGPGPSDTGSGIVDGTAKWNYQVITAPGSNGLYLTSVGNNGTIENVSIDQFSGNGLYFNYGQDIKFWNMFIACCGETPATYGLTIAGGSNQLHFYGCRFEGCIGLMHITAGSNALYFTDCHIEDGWYGAANGFNQFNIIYTAPPILIDTVSSACAQITFNGCSINTVPLSVLMTQNAQSAAAVAPFVSSTGVTEDLLITNCHFNQSAGAKFLAISSGFGSYSKVIGNFFNATDCSVYCVAVQYCDFLNNTVIIADNSPGNSSTLFEFGQFTASRVDGNRIFCYNPSGSTKTAGYVLQALDANGSTNCLGWNSVNANLIYGYSNSTWNTQNIGPVLIVTTAPVANTYNMDLFPDNNINFQPPGTVTINSFSNVKQGQMITVWGVGGPLTITYNGASLILKGAVNATPGNGQLVTLQNPAGSTYTFEVGRNY